jgi:hypothetical protein
MFVHFENFEASAPVFPNAAGAQVKTKRIAKVDFRQPAAQKFSTQGMDDSLTSWDEAFASEGPEPEREQMSKGISGALTKVAKVASVFNGVPLLNSISKPVEWAARLGSGIASTFGWSKPNTDSVTQPFINRPFRTFGNAEGNTCAETMSIIANPMIGVMPGFAGTDIDEMSFNYLKSIPAYTHTFAWTTSSSASDSSLYQKKIGMAGLIVETTSVTGLNTNIFRTGAPFVVLSELFNCFRGGIVVTFKFVKTEYHSGRLSVTFTPSHSPTTAVPNNDEATYALREIIDIRETTEISFVLPYLLAQTYTSTDIGTMGTLDVRVLNELRAPAAAATTISVNVYYHAATDFELQCSTNYELVPVTPQSGCELSDIVPQAGDDTGNIIKVIGNLPVPVYDESTTANCASEAFSSVKQLISRYSRCYFPSTTDPTVSARFSIYPFFLSAVSGLDQANGITPGVWGDTLSFIASAFALSRGGVRFAFSESSDARVTVTTHHVPLPSRYMIGSIITNFTFPTDESNVRIPGRASFAGPVALFNQVVDGVEVLVPHQTTAPVRPNIYLDSDTESLLNAPVPGVTDVYLSLNFHTNSADLNVYRSAADDYQLGYFIGFPCLLHRNYVT